MGGTGVAEAFPPEWLHPTKLRVVLRCLKVLPISARRKKGALHEWCVTVGVRMKGWMVAYVTGRPAGEI